MRPWYLGNTTVRSPFRLRDGLTALASSALQGNLHGKMQEIAFRNLLGEHDVVGLGEDQTNSLGRKWRSALSKLGFLYPKIPTIDGLSQNDIGATDTITPNGWRLIRSETVPAMQECFLRALAAYYIPSVIEKDYSFRVFSPLRHTLAIMLELAKITDTSHINFLEMALIVQLTNSEDDIKEIVNRILNLREQRERTGNKRQFDNQEYKKAAELHKYVDATFRDYADTNFRYLKATGLVQSKGHGISLVLEKYVFVENLVQDTSVPDSPDTYFRTLCEGAILPTDHKDSALAVFNDQLEQLQSRGISFDIRKRSLDTVADIAIVRHEIENLLFEYNEEEYAKQQVSKWQEIVAYMELIITRGRSKTLPSGEEIAVPKTEAPAYFEWILWRAFLAINSLINKPYEARRFKVDQDFLPVGTAPGNGPDLIFEFEDFVLVVEVTLTDNSRQEAAEGEPVRRHVANLVSHYQKKVYGLFIANRIDSNTAETFRIGIWYARDDSRMQLDIIPLTLKQFKEVFTTLFQSEPVDVHSIRTVIDVCIRLRSEHEAPAWKREIERSVNEFIGQIPK